MYLNLVDLMDYKGLLIWQWINLNLAYIFQNQDWKQWRLKGILDNPFRTIRILKMNCHDCNNLWLLKDGSHFHKQVLGAQCSNQRKFTLFQFGFNKLLIRCQFDNCYYRMILCNNKTDFNCNQTNLIASSCYLIMILQ